MARTYFHTNTPQPTATHAAAFELLADRSPPPVPVDLTVSGIGTGGSILVAFTSAAGEPNSAQWPTGDYTATIDVVAMDSTTTFAFATQGNAPGHLARVDATLDVDLEAHEQAAPAFSTPGLKTVTFAAQTWLAGSVGDRLEALLAAVKVFGHGNDSIAIRIDGDGLIVGPWQGGGIEPAGLVTFDGSVETLHTFDAELVSLLGFDLEIV
jgi:hypothetical protein